MSTSSLPNLPHRTAEIDEVWSYVLPGLDRIMKEENGSLSIADQQYLYTAVYNYCTSIKSHGNLTGSRTGANLVGKDLYDKLDEYFGSLAQSIASKCGDVQGEKLLSIYVAEWERYTKRTKRMERLFEFLNRHWIKRERDEGKKNNLYVGKLALSHWHSGVVIPLQGENRNIYTVIMDSFRRQRNGEQADSSLIKSVLESFIAIGINIEDMSVTTMTVYKNQFRDQFFAESESQIWQKLVPIDASDHAKKVQVIDSEKKLGEDNLPTSGAVSYSEFLDRKFPLPSNNS